MDGWFAEDDLGLSEDLAVLIKPELAPGERLLWAARSDPRRGDRVMPVLTVGCWLAGSGFVFALAIAALLDWLGPWFRPIENLLAIITAFAVLAFIISFTWFIHMLGSAMLRGRTLHRTSYALTDRRAIVWRPVLFTSGLEVFSYRPGTFQHVHRKEYPDGAGDITFSPVVAFATTAEPPKGFEAIAEVRRVEYLVLKTLLADLPPSEDFRPSHPVRGPRRWEDEASVGEGA